MEIPADSLHQTATYTRRVPLDELGKGDVPVVAEWDRATSSMFAGIHIIERINPRGALIKVLDTLGSPVAGC